MQFYNYLNEEYKFSQIWEILNDECSEYMSFLGDMTKKYSLHELLDKLPYRGMNVNLSQGLLKKKTRKNRKPRDMPEEIHNTLGDLFKKKFGWNARTQGMFAISDFDQAVSYGRSAFPVFPSDGFKFVYSPTIQDLLTELEIQGIVMEVADTWKIAHEIEDEEDERWLREKLEEIVNKYTNKNLEKGLKSMAEISFLCDHYYVIDTKYLFPLLEKLAGRR